MSGDEQPFNQSFFECEIRKQKYKELLNYGREAAEKVETSSFVDNMNVFTELVIESNKLCEEGDPSDRCGQSGEIVLDAQVIKLANNLMAVTAQQIENENFSDAAFVAALTKNLTDDMGVLDWSKLDQIVNRMSSSLGGSTSMYGSFDFDAAYQVQASQRQRQTRRRDDVGTVKKPTEISNEELESEKKSKKVDYIKKRIDDIYRKGGNVPIPYYKLIIDPTNMMHTFDNSFQISFLFRDGLIAFEKDEEEMPCIRPLLGPNKPPKPAENTSFVSRLDMTIINKYIEKYNISKPLLNPPRD